MNSKENIIAIPEYISNLWFMEHIYGLYKRRFLTTTIHRYFSDPNVAQWVYVLYTLSGYYDLGLEPFYPALLKFYERIVRVYNVSSSSFLSKKEIVCDIEGLEYLQSTFIDYESLLTRYDFCRIHTIYTREDYLFVLECQNSTKLIRT